MLNILACEAGRVMVYNTDIEAELDEVEQISGIDYQILCHNHEAGNSLTIIKQRFGSTLCCHEIEVAPIAEHCTVDRTFRGDKNDLGNLQVFHTPGHTAGSLSLLFESKSGNTYLFSGDTIFGQNEGGFGTLVQAENIETAKKSLRFYKSLNPSHVFWPASPATSSYYEMTNDEWQASIDDAIQNMKPFNP